MDVAGKNALVLGGHGLVGMAVCRELLAQRPAGLVVASRRRAHAERAVARLRGELGAGETRISAAWGDVFLRATWQKDDFVPMAAVVDDAERRAAFIADVLDPLSEDVVGASTLTQLILGSAPGLDGAGAAIVVDCMNTATALGYQDIYRVGQHVAGLARAASVDTDWPAEAERLLASLSVPQLVRHIQLLHEAMRRAGTQAYVKVGTTGTGGMGFNIPYTHGEEKPSRLLLSKAALAGAQTLLTFLLARTPGGPAIVKEIKPSAMIGWREIGHGPIGRDDRHVPLFDCPIETAVRVDDAASLVPRGDFGQAMGETLQGVYVDTGENGLYAAAEFAAITALTQMQFVTPEEIARNVVREIQGGNTGRDVIAGLDGAVMGPSYRGGYLREAALTRLGQLEAIHGEAVAFEMLGPPRLSKLLFEAHLLKRVAGTIGAVLGAPPAALAAALEREIGERAELRARIVSIGLPILLPDGERLLRGPEVKADDAHHGWVDLTVANVRRWQERLGAIVATAERERTAETSSRCDRAYSASRDWRPAAESFDVGDIAAWIFTVEDQGARTKG